ncbi:MAG: TatD family hydrolase [bacterium]
MPELFDTHIHLDDPRFNGLTETIIEQAIQLGISSFLIPGTTAERSNQQFKIIEQHTNIYAAIGLHPWFTHDTSDLDLVFSRQNHPQVVAVGEIGLDFMLKKESFVAQTILFIEQLKRASLENLPVILHVRKAHQEVLALLKKHRFPYGGVVHAFSGSAEQAKEYIKLGFKIGIGGIITHPNATRRRQFASHIGSSDFVLETDAPDMPIFGLDRGALNKPAFLLNIAQCFAELRNQNLEEVASQNRLNAQSVFNLN